MPSTYRLDGFGLWITSSGLPIYDYSTSLEVTGPTNGATFSYETTEVAGETFYTYEGDVDQITVEGAFVTIPRTFTPDFSNTGIYRVSWSGGISDVAVVVVPTGTVTSMLIFGLGGASIDGIDTQPEALSFLLGFRDTGLQAPSSGDFAPGQTIRFDEIAWDSVTAAPKPAGREATGTDFANVLNGTDGDDRLDGAGGNDSIFAADGADIVIGGDGDDVIEGGRSADDERDVIYGGAGNDSIDGGYGNDELRGDAGNDTIEGGFGVDTIIGGTGDDALSGSALSDLIFGGDGEDFINGGFGFDRLNGGDGADRFYHAGVLGHGSDWIQDFDASSGDMLQFGGAAQADDFQVNIASTTGAGSAEIDEAFVIYRPTGQILWALVDGAEQTEIMLRTSEGTFDLLV